LHIDSSGDDDDRMPDYEYRESGARVPTAQAGGFRPVVAAAMAATATWSLAALAWDALIVWLLLFEPRGGMGGGGPAAIGPAMIAGFIFMLALSAGFAAFALSGVCLLSPARPHKKWGARLLFVNAASATIAATMFGVAFLFGGH
jgi:hypothetical protein